MSLPCESPETPVPYCAVARLCADATFPGKLTVAGKTCGAACAQGLRCASASATRLAAKKRKFGGVRFQTSRRKRPLPPLLRRGEPRRKSRKEFDGVQWSRS